MRGYSYIVYLFVAIWFVNFKAKPCDNNKIFLTYTCIYKIKYLYSESLRLWTMKF
jgi:hypothetical protein